MRHEKRPAEVGIAELRSKLAAHLRAVRAGQSITIVERGRPVARLVPAGELPALRVRPATGTLKDVKLPPRPKNLRPGDLERALREERADRDL